MDQASTARMLEYDAALLSACDLSSHDSWEAAFRAEAERRGVKLGDLLMPLRVAVTGSRVSPPLYESLIILGLEEALARIEKARASLA
jgi:glutamyl-tRNA synthetase